MAVARMNYDEHGAVEFEGVFKCPHCGHENSHRFGIWSAPRPVTVCCDNETGGCDTYFAVTAIIDVTVTPTARKIEGIERRPPAAWENEA